MHNRQTVCQDLLQFLQAHKEVIAAWEGGSAATGFLDAYSDLDLLVICKDEAVERVLKSMQEYITKQYGIMREYRVPEPSWHGLSQIFIQIKDSEPLFYLDLAFAKKSNPNKLMESDRHGSAKIWFEKEKVYDSTPTNNEVTMQRCKSLFKVATETDFVSLLEIKKNIARQLFLEAFPMLYTFSVRNLSILLNLKYRPAKVDFGVRYAYRDYSTQDKQLIENTFKVANLQELEQQLQAIEKRFYALKSELELIYK